jgi:hypothetical protein
MSVSVAPSAVPMSLPAVAAPANRASYHRPSTAGTVTGAASDNAVSPPNSVRTAGSRTGRPWAGAASTRASPSQRELHLRLMEESLVEGTNPTEVAQAAAKKFGVSVRQTWDDLKEIYRRWEAAGIELQDHSEMMLAQAVRCCEQIYR